MASPNLLAQAAGLGDAQGVGVLTNSMRIGQDMAAQRQAMAGDAEDRARRNELLKAFPDAIRGDENALARVAQSDPQTYMGIQDYHVKRQTAAQAQLEQRLQTFAGAALYGLDAIEKAPENERQAAYQGIVGQVAQLDPEAFQALGGAPQQYDPQWTRAARARLMPMAIGREKFAAFLAEQQKPKQEEKETFDNPVDELDAEGRPVRVQYGNRGTRKVVAGAQPAPKGRGGQLTIDPETGQVVVAAGGGSLKETEGKAVTYGIRAAAGLEKLEKIEDSGYQPENMMDRVAENVPAGNFMLSKSGQQYKQAAAEFLAAILRKDTGAAVTKEEWSIYGAQFFPRAGDSDDVIKQKRESRRTALEALRAGSGAGAPMIPAPGSDQQQGGGNVVDWSSLSD